MVNTVDDPQKSGGNVTGRVLLAAEGETGRLEPESKEANMSMAAIPFDSLDYFERLKDAGFTEKQARVQTDVMRQQAEAQRVALQTALDRYDEASRKELATRGDLQDVRNELKEDLQDVRNEMLRLENRMEANKHEVLKWVIGTMVAQTALIVAVMAFLK